MRRQFLALGAFTTFLSFLPFTRSASATNDAAPLSFARPREDFSHHRFLAKPLATTRPAELQAVEDQKSRRVRRAFSRLGNLRIVAPAPGESVATAIHQLRATGLYEYVEPDYVRSRHALPNDPRFTNGDQWHLNNAGQNSGTPGADIGAPAAWDIRTDASDVIVAVIDTGVRMTHEDLAANLWTNPGEIPGNGLDDDANGYIDDVHGINSLAASGSAAGGRPDDDFGHGTFIAGLIGAAGGNNKGGTGVAWKARIMALKFDDTQGSATVSRIIECIDYALAKGAHIINLSYGSYGYSQAEFEAVERARNAGVIFVVSAGNDAVSNDLYPHYPANYLLDNVITVAATDRRDQLADFSNYSVGLVELAAPGTAITSTGHTDDAAYVVHDGTSFAAPLVAGSLALLKAQFPADDYRALINRLLRSVQPRSGLAGKVQTGGRLNLAAALASATQRPVNDDFANRTALTGAAVTLRTHTLHATAEAGEPQHAWTPANGTLWWSWTAPYSGNAVVETTGSGFDTVLNVYTGSTLAGLTSLSADDNQGRDKTSRAAFEAIAGTTYQIAVGGRNDVTGALILTVGYRPPNDQFADAITLTGESLRMTGFNTVASSEIGEPESSLDPQKRTVWYKWTAPASGFYAISLFAYGFDAVGTIYTGNALSRLATVATTSTEVYNEPGHIDATAGTTYRIQVDSANAATGVFEIVIVDAAGLPNYYPLNSSPVYSPTSTSFFSTDVQGTVSLLNFEKTVYDYGQLDGPVDVQTPALAPDGALYIGDESGYFHAFDPALKKRWRADLGPVRVTSSPALAADGTTYIHTDDGYLHAFLPDGTRKWRTVVPGESYSSPSIGSDGTLYIGADDHRLYAIAPRDGTVKWTFLADGEIYASPAIDDRGTLYFGTLGGEFYAVSADGAQQWKYSAGGAISSSAALATDGTVYFGCYDRHLYALTSAGALKWTYATGDEIRGSSPAVASDGTVYIGSYDGYLHAVTPAGAQKRVYATGGYIRSSPLIDDGGLYISSGDTRFYVVYIGASLATSPWPMHRQNPRRTGRRLGTTAPAILGQPAAQTVPLGAGTTLSADINGADTLAFQWHKDGHAIVGASQSTLSLPTINPSSAGVYSVIATNSLGSIASAGAIVGPSTTDKVTGAGAEAGSDIFVAANGNTFDQVLLTGVAATITADFNFNQITRISFLDRNDDIVQVELSGPGSLSLVLDAATDPATPEKYNQSVKYMKGHAGLVITGATEFTNVSVFSVGRITAVNQALFKSDVSYDGIADIAFIAINSANGKFGGIRTANTRYSASSGLTGIYAPGVTATGPVYLGNINAAADAQPVIVLGSAANTRITGGDLAQDNKQPVVVSGLTQLLFTPGGDSHGNPVTAKTNQAVLRNTSGTDVTAQIVVNP